MQTAAGRRQGLARTASGRVAPGRFALCLTCVFFRRSDRKGVRSRLPKADLRRGSRRRARKSPPAGPRRDGVATRFPAEKGLRRYRIENIVYPLLVATRFPAEKGLRPLLLSGPPSRTSLQRGSLQKRGECVTFDGVRQTKGRWFGGKNVYGTTRTLAGGQVPFGWLLVSVREGYAPESAEDAGIAVVADAVSAPLATPASPRERLESLLQSFTLRLKACSPAQWPGMFPDMAKAVLLQRTEDPEYAEGRRGSWLA